MPDTLWNIEWPNINTQRKYPLCEGQTVADGDFVLPNDFLVDMVIPVNIGMIPAVDPTKFHLAQVGVFSSGIVVSIAYDETVFATINVPTTGFVEYGTYPIVGVSPFFDTRGWLVVGQLDSILRNPGAWNFSLSTARIVPTVIRPNLRALTSIRVANGQDYSEAMAGDITLVAGQNFRFRVVPELNHVIFDCIDGGGMEEDCVCTDIEQQAPCIRTINGVRPNAAGELTLRGTTCVALSSGTNAITISDSCSEPCCDCRELKVITDELEVMLSNIQDLETAAARMDAVLINIQGNILASKSTGIPR